MSEFNRSYYAIIPAEIRYDEDLTPNAKLLYGEITALCNEHGYCWATNNYFAELYKVSRVTVSKWISQLAEKGYITVDIEYREGTKEVLRRCIRINTPHKEKFNTPIKKSLIPHKEKFNTPHKEKLKDNNTSMNNTYEYNNRAQTGSGSSKLFESTKTTSAKNSKVKKWMKEKEAVLAEFEFDSAVSQKLYEFLDMLAESKTLLPDVSFRAQLEKLIALPVAKQLNAITKTIIRGWKSLDYAIDDEAKSAKPSFDTAKYSQNQFKNPNNDTRREKYEGQETF